MQMGGTHPLFIQFEELFSDFGCAERQPQTGDAELGDDLFQNLLEWQTPHGAVPPRRRHRILQDEASQCHKLKVARNTHTHTRDISTALGQV